MHPSSSTEPDSTRRGPDTGHGSCAGTDRDVPAAVGEVLEGLLRERIARARTLDETFARDIAERVADFTLHGGGRTRSQFLWWSMRACGGAERERPAALRVAAALELIQTCALVLDDVMDGSSRRRGRSAFHTRLEAQYPTSRAAPPGAVSFGASAAVLGGDLALVWADDIIADTAYGHGVRPRVLSLWRALRMEMVAGQYLDLRGQGQGQEQGQEAGFRSVARAMRTACLKSALYSVERPLALGAALAGADDRTTRALCSAGRNAGIAFQLRDDIEGVFGDPRTTGKPSGDDMKAGRLTCLAAVARATAASRGDTDSLAVLDNALGNPALTRAGLEEVRQVLVATGARSAVETRIERLLAVGSRRLAAAALSSPASARLARLLNAVAAPRTGVPPAHTGPVQDGIPALLTAGVAEGDR
ncbi:polyprenyl synthetase family protein [Streptomyces enissocaesilis]|uniref:Polyprenyl synthetase family protein n=2 Tax=Streptomyces enissocaesilis TaxID=332589 RepID=A0ABN3XC60_9ACTN